MTTKAERDVRDRKLKEYEDAGKARSDFYFQVICLATDTKTVVPGDVIGRFLIHNYQVAEIGDVEALAKYHKAVKKNEPTPEEKEAAEAAIVAAMVNPDAPNGAEGVFDLEEFNALKADDAVDKLDEIKDKEALAVIAKDGRIKAAREKAQELLDESGE